MCSVRYDGLQVLLTVEPVFYNELVCMFGVPVDGVLLLFLSLASKGFLQFK